MLSQIDLTALLITLRLAAATTLILLVFGTPLAWWLATTRSKARSTIEAVIALPLVLPPTVLGFYLLLAFSPDGPIGATTAALGLPSMAFSFWGLVAGSAIYSIPFVVQPLQNSFASLGVRQLEVAKTLGAGPVDRFVSIVIPLSKIGYLTAAVLGFAHTLGEFGVVLMIGGNIPGQTQVLSIAIYDHVEALEYSQAHWLAGGLLISSFLVLLMIYGANRKFHLMKTT